MNMKYCKTHNKMILFYCLYSNCSTPFMCRNCYTDHVDNHDLDIIEICNPNAIENVVNSYNDKCENLKNQTENIASTFFAMNDKFQKELKAGMKVIGEALSEKFSEIQNEAHNFLGSMKNHIAEFCNGSESLVKIPENQIIDQNYLSTISNLRNENFPKIEKSFDFAQKSLRDMDLAYKNISNFHSKFIKLIQDVQVKHLFYDIFELNMTSLTKSTAEPIDERQKSGKREEDNIKTNDKTIDMDITITNLNSQIDSLNDLMALMKNITSPR